MNSVPQFPPSFFLLQQEGYLISACLTGGLTALRAANVHNKGGFYAALFSLSIGIERLLKAIIIMDHMLKHNLAAPTSRQLKGYGHNILGLYSTTQAIAVQRDVQVPLFTALDSIDQSLLDLMSEFAQSTRYHNLDSLASSQVGRDPLTRWGEIILSVLGSDVSERQRTKILNHANVVSNLIESNTLVLMHGLDQQPLSLVGALSLPGLHDSAVRFVVLRLVKILSPARLLIESLSHDAYNEEFAAPPFPQMHEFLEWLWDDRSYVLRKKRWP